MQRNKTYKLVAIGVSAGGLNALKIILGGLPASFSLPVAIVQHREASADKKLIELLQQECSLAVTEIEDKMPIRKGTVFIAPGGYHTLIEEDHFALSTEEPVNFSMPSVDLLFETAVYYYGSAIIGIILTGGNSNGTAGLAKIKNAGGLTIVQNPDTAEAGTMPLAALSATRVDHILDLNKIAPFLAKLNNL